ncbi:MAG: MFS transporter [Defluviitaleaceae bacterium]|nr:MFS transporter [Defluviitaleaceae bacterium]
MKKSWFLLLAAYAAFFAIGMPEAFGVALPGIRFDMGLSRGQASAIMIVNSLSYALAASQAGRLEKFLRLKWVTGGGFFMLMAGIAGYIISPNLAGMLVSTSLLGAGASLVDAGANALVVSRFSARHMNHLHCFWAMGGAISPLIMRQMIIYYDWRTGYAAIFAVQFLILLILLISILRGLWDARQARGDSRGQESKAAHSLEAEQNSEAHPPEAEQNSAGGEVSFITARRFQYLQFLVFFVYVAFESSVTIWTVDVLLNSARRDVVFETAGLFPAVYLGALMAGRFIFGYITEKFSGITVIRTGFFIAGVGLVALIFTSNIIGIALVGFGFAPIFPCLMNETKRRFDPAMLSKLVGMQVAAAGAGAALGSLAIGQILENISLDAFFPAIIALVIAAFVLNEIIERARRNVNASAL